MQENNGIGLNALYDNNNSDSECFNEELPTKGFFFSVYQNLNKIDLHVLSCAYKGCFLWRTLNVLNLWLES